MSYAKIAAELNMKTTTVQNFLTRANQNRVTKILTKAPKIAPVVDQVQNQTLVELYTVAERTRVKVMHSQMRKVTQELESPELDAGTRLRARIEVIKALRAGATMPEIEKPMRTAQRDGEIKGLRLIVVRPEPLVE